MCQLPPIVLSFAANDPSGGAGIQADILTLSSLGCHPLSVITAITIQDTVGVNNVMALDPKWVTEQECAVLEDMPVNAFKIGMLGNIKIITAIAEVVSNYPDIPLVLDPILASGRGDEFASEHMMMAMRDLLFPLATIITPNSIEARRLMQNSREDFDITDLSHCAHLLLQTGCKHVLITGTHEDSPEVVNTLYGAEGIVRSDTWQRFKGSYHGSGCTLASAIAATLAHGLPLTEGVYEAQEYTWQSLKAGFRPGMGQYLPDRLFWTHEKHSVRKKD